MPEGGGGEERKGTGLDSPPVLPSGRENLREGAECRKMGGGGEGKQRPHYNWRERGL